MAVRGASDELLPTIIAAGSIRQRDATHLWVWLDVEGREHLEAVTASGRPYIVAFWHGRILPLSLYFRGRGIVVITSENFDGEWIARIITKLGYGTARGSSSRHARAAGSYMPT